MKKVIVFIFVLLCPLVSLPQSEPVSSTWYVKFLLQGATPLNSNVMRSDLTTNELVPLSCVAKGAYDQHYPDQIKWVDLQNGESVNSKVAADPTIVDVVQLELRLGNPVVPEARVYKMGVVDINGNLRTLDGQLGIPMEDVTTGYWYIIINHRNHVSIMSSVSISVELEEGVIFYDFTTSDTKYYGGNYGGVPLGNGYWGMGSGDCTGACKNSCRGENYVDYSDGVDIENYYDERGYLHQDLTMNGLVDEDDYTLWFVNFDRISQVPWIGPDPYRPVSSQNFYDKNTQTNPKNFSLQNFPNPFNPTTTITFELFKKQFVSLSIYDNNGREIKTLLDEVKQPGKHSIKFHAENLSSGIYYYKIKTGEFVETKRMILMK